MKTRLFKNRFLPKKPPDGSNSIQEGGFGFRIPRRLCYVHTMTTRMFSEDQTNNAKQPQQARSHTQHRIRYILSRCLKSQMSTDFLEGCFNGPTRRKPADDLGTTEARIRGIEVFIPVCALAIMHKDPANRYQASTSLIPLACATNPLNTSFLSAIPTDRRTCWRLSRYDLCWCRQPASLGTRAADGATRLGRQGVKTGITIEPTDQRGMLSMTMTKASQIMRGIAPVSQEYEFTLWKPMDQYGHQLTSQMGCGLMPASFCQIQILGAIHRQGPAQRMCMQ